MTKNICFKIIFKLHFYFKRLFPSLLLLLVACGCFSTSNKKDKHEEPPFVWENANIYFLLTDRFNNGDPSNDINFDRSFQDFFPKVMIGFGILSIFYDLFS